MIKSHKIEFFHRSGFPLMNLCQKMAILNELVDVAKRRRNELNFFFGGSTLLMHGRSECPKLIRPLLPPRVGPSVRNAYGIL